jgi:hypothetical protein
MDKFKINEDKISFYEALIIGVKDLLKLTLIKKILDIHLN